jgi:PPK2 family polyphosphate:nucleotide phosphotransferase
MAIPRETLERIRVAPGSPAALDRRNPGWTGEGGSGEGGSGEAGPSPGKKEARAALEDNIRQLADAQELLWASGTHALLVIFQAMDAGGKDSTIKHVMSGINPQGCQVVSFREPSDEEFDHNFLWRYAKAVPRRGRIGIFNRSYYEEVLVVRVHPELLARQRLVHDPGSEELWAARMEDIAAFERHLDRNGVKIVKFFLHISKKEQRKRLLARLEDPRKRWKFSPADLEEREHWDEYMAAFEQAITATSTEWAPWYVVPADRKWVARMLVSSVLSEVVNRLDLRHPELSNAELKELEEARRRLRSE